MTVGSGYGDPVEPGNESTAASADNAVAKGVPFITADGIVGIISGDYPYDGHSHQGTITALETASTSNVRVTVSGISWTTGGRYNGAWLYLADGDGIGTWYKVDWANTSENYIYIAGVTADTFAGAVGDTVEIGRIHAIRDFAYLRPEGSAKFDRILVDHNGADGTESADEVAVLHAQVFSQGLTPDTPLIQVGSTQVDESQRNSVKWRRLGYDAAPAANPRSSRLRMRLKAMVRNTAITIRQMRVGAKIWPR